MNTELHSIYLAILVSVISWSTIVGTNTDLVQLDTDDIGYSDPEAFEDTDIQKRRLSSFVRIGRGLSSFIRIGRNGLYVPYDNSMDEVPDELDDDKADSSAFANTGKDEIGLSFPNKRRMSSFVRIGRGDGQPGIYQPYTKRAGAFIRVGKFPSSGYFRSRYTGNQSPYYRRTGRIGQSSFIRIGKRDTSSTLKNQAMKEEYERYLQLQKDMEDENGAQPDNDYYPYNDIKQEDKKMSSFVRIGRPSSFVRIGRPYSSFVRIGKSLVPGNGNGEALADGFELEADDPTTKEDEKRLSRFVRIGKNKELINDAIFKRRLSNFVRIGKRKDANSLNSIGENALYTDNVKRRMSSFVRIGKAGENKMDDDTKDVDILTDMKDEDPDEQKNMQ